MVREEKNAWLNKQNLTPKTMSLNFLKTTASSRPQTATASDSFQFKKNVEQKFQNFMQHRERISEDNSLLQNSQQSRDKSEKKRILEQQKQQRSLAAQEKKRKELEKTQKIKDGLDELDRKCRQNIKNQAQRERKSKSREKSRQRSMEERNAELVKKHAPDRSQSKSGGAAAQLKDLKSWIEEQIRQDSIDDSNMESSDRDHDTKSKKRQASTNSTGLSLKQVGVTTDEQKLKMLKHQLPGNSLLSEQEEAKLGSRQNRYGVFQAGQNDFDKVVEIQRGKSQPKKETESSVQKISGADQQKSKDHVRDLIMQLAKKSGITLQKVSSTRKDDHTADTQQQDNLSEDSCDKIPVKQTDKLIDTQLNYIKPVAKAMTLNAKAIEPTNMKQQLPGVTDARKTQELLDKEQKDKESKAVLIIQKFLRGHWGRKDAAKLLTRRQNQINEEYARFQREYKNEQGYNLKQYVKDKQKMRSKMGLQSIDEIEEVIGESSSANTAQIVQSSLQLQNFFKFGQQSSDYDPLSLISIYAKKHSKATLKNKVTKEQVKIANLSKKNAKEQLISSSLIEEDIYSDKFDNQIEEDIQKVSSSAGSVAKNKQKKVQSPIESQSIADEAPSAALSNSESIADEVGIAAKNQSDKESSILEDSIIRDEYESDNYKIKNAKKQLEARTRVTYSLNTDQLKGVSEQRQKIMLQAEEQKRSGEIKSGNLISQLLNQMKEYETATLSQNFVDRMEKIVTSSLAQKDQIIMAQRLAELERENRHQEEINRIREEQIRLLTQLMLQGSFQASNQIQTNQILDSIKNISQKPVIIRDQPVFQQIPIPLTHQQLYQQNQRTKITYLEEYDQSKRSSKYSSGGKYSDIKDELSANKKITGLGEDIIDEVGSIKSDSIVEEIEVSQEKSSSDNFEELKNRQTKLAINNKNLLATYIVDMEKEISRVKQHKEQVLTSHLRLKKISPRSYQRKRNELEEWATREKRQAKDKHASILLQNTESQKTNDLKSNLKKPILEESNDSEQVKRALYQANLLEQGIIGLSPDQRYIQRKKEAADKLIQEKEKVIQEQLSSKILHLEKEKAQEVLQQALEFDVEKEVERRFQAIKKQIEESQGVESARSGISQSKDSAQKQKKVVKFQDQDKQQIKQQIDSSNNIEESIQEEISNSYSQSFKSSSAIESRSKSQTVNQQLSHQRAEIQAAPQAHQHQKSPIRNKSENESIAEIISDNYTDDFNNSESASNQGAQSNNYSESKSRLQNKARDLADSAAYSQDVFEEESMGLSQSAGGLKQLQQLVNNKKMDSVVEESIDESAGRSKASSKLESANLQSQSQVQSEDQEIQGSHQSVDWQIQVPQESARTGQDFSEKSIHDDSSLNSRLEPDDEFESNPDNISRSVGQSTSDDIQMRAEFIAQDLLEQILKEYKDDNSYIVSCEKKNLDEDEFRNKFPYTLDVKLVEQEIRPPSLQSQTVQVLKPVSSTPAKKAKTSKEIQDEIYLEKHRQEQEQLKQLQNQIKDFLEFLITKLDIEQLTQSLNKPIERNLLAELAKIMDYDDNIEVTQLKNMKSESQPILSETLFLKIEQDYANHTRQKLRNQGFDTTTKQESYANVHFYAVFQALNEVLAQRRLYGDKGEPAPWSGETRFAQKTITTKVAEIILKQASQKVFEWSINGAGSKYAPLPPPPTQTQDEFGEEIVQPPLQEGEEDRKNQHRQDKLGQLMTQDIQETDLQWVDYEVEDAQVRFDLADMILADLAGEIADFLRQ